MILCSPYETIEWLGMRLEVPRDWQIVRHGTSEKLGTLRFVDRHSERLTLVWHKLAREPDLDRMLAEQRHQDAAPSGRQLEELRVVGWRGYRVRSDERNWVRAVRFDEASGRLLDAALTLETAGARGATVTEELLANLRPADTAATRGRLRAFDVDLEFPHRLAITKAEVVPAKVSIEFGLKGELDSAPVRATAVLCRLGMAKSWYRGNALGLLMRENPGVEFRRNDRATIHGHEVLSAEGDTTSSRLARLFGRSSKCRAQVWHCDSENAVYCLTTRSSDRLLLSPAEFALRCCKHSHAEETGA